MKPFNLSFLFSKENAALFALYTQQTQIVESAAELLDKLAKAETFEARNNLCKEIKKCESKGDQTADEIFDALYEAKHTEYNRVDLHLLVSKIETFLDFIHDSAKKLVIYHPYSIDSLWIEIIEAIVEDAKIISGIVPELPSLGDKAGTLLPKCLRIKEIEHEVDDLYECYMSNLFQVEKDAIELTKNKNIIQSLEDTTDKAKEIAECIKTMIIKHRR